jgi:hypothetical protein
VLIVEPEEDVRGLYFDWFCSAAFDIMCAVDGTVTHALAERYPPDLVVAELEPGFPFSPPRIQCLLHLHTGGLDEFLSRSITHHYVTSR